ncbi:MAG: hypothetical protein WDZ88_02525 [Candidatus Paceibacterota bacterium]
MANIFAGAVFTVLSFFSLNSDAEGQGEKFSLGATSIRYGISEVQDDTFWQEYHHHFTNRIDIAFERSFRPMRLLEMKFDSHFSPREYVDDLSGEFISSFEEGLKFSAEEVLYDVSLKFQFDDAFQTILGRMIGKTEERYLSPDAVTSVNAERWWKKEETFDYGLRPFRFDPYIFFTFAPQSEERELFKVHTRLRMSDAGSLASEVFLYKTIFDDWRFGSWYRHTTGERRKSSLAVGLQKEFTPGQEVSFMFSDRKNETGLFAGYTSWW